MATGLGFARKPKLPNAGTAAPRARRSRRQLPELILIPQDLRTADPSLFAELSAGSFGLAGATAVLDGRSPFQVTPPSPAWQAALLGFGWLSDLRAANSPDADALACQTVDDWLTEAHAGDGPDWQLAIAGRRLLSWLSNAGMLTETAAPDAVDRFLAGLDIHMRQITEQLQTAKSPDALTAHIAVLTGCLCLTSQDKHFQRAVTGLKTELARQILPSGGHVNRNPGVTVELLLDLLPLKQCFLARERKPPEWLLVTMQRMAANLRHMQLGDRGLARFNGMAANETDQLATVLSYHAGAIPPAEAVASSGYLRLSRRTTTVLADGGMLPPKEFGRQAHAGTLAFEMSSGPALVIVNAGAPSPSGQGWRRQSRGTAAHSTLLLNDTASSRLVEAGLDHLAGPSMAGGKVLEASDGATEFQGFHNGYEPRYGMTHARVLRLSPQGDKLSGSDRIYYAQRVAARGRSDLSYSVHFHIHPQASVRYGAEPAMALITLANGEIWTFSAFGSKLGLEDSLYFASFTGPTRTVQIVLRGHVLADTQIGWSIERGMPVPKPRLADPS